MGDHDGGNAVTGGGTGGNTSGTGGPEHGSMGEGAADVPTGGGQGDDLADVLGGREGGGAGTQEVAKSGDMSAGRSERSDAGAPTAAGARGGGDAGSPGGMGGVRGGMPNPDHRPNGGVSPLQNSSGDNDRH